MNTLRLSCRRNEFEMNGDELYLYYSSANVEANSRVVSSRGLSNQNVRHGNGITNRSIHTSHFVQG